MRPVSQKVCPDLLYMNNEENRTLYISFRTFSMIGTLSKIFNKKCFDIRKKDVSMCEYQNIIAIGLITNGFFFQNPNSKIRFILPFFNLSFYMFGICMMAINIYHCIKTKNIPDMSESLSYLVIVEVLFVYQCTFLSKNKKMHKLFDIMEKDFVEMQTAPDRIR